MIKIPAGVGDFQTFISLSYNSYSFVGIKHKLWTQCTKMDKVCADHEGKLFLHLIFYTHPFLLKVNNDPAQDAEWSFILVAF